MEKIYSEEQNTCKLAKAKPATIQFLLNYSKSLRFAEYSGFKFETNLN
ncbi:hypothetical protein [Eudoraea sp.]